MKKNYYLINSIEVYKEKTVQLLDAIRDAASEDEIDIVLELAKQLKHYWVIYNNAIKKIGEN